MQNFFTLSISLILSSVAFTQSTWQLEDYSKWNHTNYRQNQIFDRPFSTSNPDYLLLDAALFYMTNEERYKVGVSPMRYHKLLEVAAYNHSLKMATTSFFSHQNSVDGSRYSTSDRGKLAGISNPSFAENIAYNNPDNGSSYIQVATKLIVQWMNSQGHKDNILSTKGRQMAAGTYFYDGKIYGTQVFQWFSDVIENPNGGSDYLPKQINTSVTNNNASVVTKTNSTITTTTSNDNYPKLQTTHSNNTQYELNEKDNEITKLNQENLSLKSANSQLEATKTNLNNAISLLQQQQNQKDLQYNNLNNEFKILSDRRTTVRKSKYNADEFHPLTFKIGFNTFYPTINPISLRKFDARLLSFGAEAMLGFNFGQSYRRNSIGFTVRANQANRFLTTSLDSSALQPIQFYDTELTTLIREWLSIGVGATFTSYYGSSSYQINPAGSIGLCLGAKNWKIQVTQQVLLNSNKKINGRASLGIALRL